VRLSSLLLLSGFVKLVLDSVILIMAGYKPGTWAGLRATFISWLNGGVPPVQVQHLADHLCITMIRKYFSTRKISRQV